MKGRALVVGLASLRVAARLAGAARQGLALGVLVAVERREPRAVLRALRRRMAIEVEILDAEIQIARVELANDARRD